MSIKKIDDALIHGLPPLQQEKVEPREVEEVPKVEVSVNEEQAEQDSQPEPERAAKDNSEKSGSEPDRGLSEVKEVKEAKEPESELDEYGLEKPKARTYSEEDVQRMIRDRLSRGQHATVNQQQTAQKAAEGFQLDPNSTDSWEVQLKEFVKHTLKETQENEQRERWQREESERQTNFEVKFSTGMEKYNDFREVVGKQPITDSMMMAIRDMDNPAQFVYAAAKLQPKELERIASISDPFQQAKEMGRLDERMRKAKAVSRTAAPLKPVTGDVGTMVKPQLKKSIDSLIQSHAKSKLR